MARLISSADVPDESDVARARDAARAWLADLELADIQVDEVLVVVSELVTNAIRHARTAFDAEIDRTDGGGVRIEVFDLDSRQPIFIGADEEAVSGRGMQIVGALAADWGSSTEERDGIRGKVVWAELRWTED